MGNRITFSLSLLFFWIRGYAEIKDSSVELCTANILFGIFPAGRRVQTFFLSQISDMEVNTKYHPGLLVMGFLLLLQHCALMLMLWYVAFQNGISFWKTLFDLGFWRDFFAEDIFRYSFLAGLCGVFLVLCSYISRLTIHLSGGSQTFYEVSVPFYERRKLGIIQDEIQKAIHY